MKTELKRAIVDFLFDNINDFQLVNLTVDRFRAYIYDPTGNYLIGGKDVADFITDAAKLLRT